MIQYLKNTATATIPEEFLAGQTLVIYRDGYALPLVPGATFVEFERYKVSYIDHQPTHIIMVGTNRIFVPSVRTEMVFEYLQTMTSHIRKMSIDTAPFVGEPWRLWFHYSLTFGEWLGVNYSYAVETDWQHWFLRNKAESIIDPNGVLANKRHTVSDLAPLATSFEFKEPDTQLADLYNRVKAFAFEKHDTPKLIVTAMLRELNKSIGMQIGFDSYLSNAHITLPDFGIYRFVAEECQRRQAIYNAAL